MRNATISRFMTHGAHTIGLKEPLVTAHSMMNEHGIRHLPVLESGNLVGMLSQRDLHFLETLRDVDPRKVTVEEAMSANVYTVSARATLRRVAGEMAERKVGSAVVVDEHDRVVGIFTTIDALKALAEILGRDPA
jgi:acetoin utilization protein AcuB